MHRPATLAALLVGAALSTSCGGGGGGGDGGPDRLWLALLDSELTVQLITVEPEPF